MNKELFLSPFALGFYLGCVFLVIATYNYLRLKGEMSRFRRHLSDKLEIEADTMKKIKGEQEALRKENESLRIKVNALNETPGQAGHARKPLREIVVERPAEARGGDARDAEQVSLKFLR